MRGVFNFGDTARESGSNWGTIIGAGRLAKGYKQAGEEFAGLEKSAYEAREMADPWGSSGYRQEAGDDLAKLLRGEADFTADPSYKWTMDQAMQATRRENSAIGFTGSGNMQTALQDRAAGIASTEYAKIIERLTGLSGATPQNAVSGASIFGDMTTASVTGQADMVLGKYSALAQRDQAAGNEMGNIAGGLLESFGFSDKRLKSNIKKVGADGPLNLYTWKWNNTAEEALGLTGTSFGYIAQEVKELLPDAVQEIKGFLAIDYGYVNEALRSYIQ